MNVIVSAAMLLLLATSTFAAGNVKLYGDLEFPDTTKQSTATVQGPVGLQGAKGDTGPVNTISVGTVTTGASGSQAAATITGIAPNQLLNLTIPQGPAPLITLSAICAAISAENAQLPSFCVIASYFPLQVGNKWVYSSFVQGKYRNDEIVGTEIINGTTTYIKDRLEPSPDNYHEKRWLAFDSNSELFFRIWSNEGPDPAVNFSPPVVENKLNPEVGDTWSWGIAPIFTLNLEVLSVYDTVTVPAGSFANCLKIKDTETVSGKVHITHYAPGIGMIRLEQPGVWVEELVYAKVGSKTYGVAP
jgi:hypothetical protein